MPTFLNNPISNIGHGSAPDLYQLDQLALQVQALAGGIAAAADGTRARAQHPDLSMLPSPGASLPRRAPSLAQAFRFDVIPFDTLLSSWALSGPIEEAQNRQQACAQLTDAVDNGGCVVDLSALNLSSLPDVFSSLVHVEHLHLAGNKLATLPNLPPFLQSLVVTGNRLTSLPELPETLIALGCDFNRLANLPDLPGSVTRLYSVGNRLLTLPRLPPALIEMDVSHNKLEHLPPVPNSIIFLSVRHNRLTSLPQLTGQISLLEIGYNQLSRLPENIEQVVATGIIEVGGNPWNAESIRRLENLPPTVFVSSAGAVQRDGNGVQPVEQEYVYRAHQPSALMERLAPKQLFKKELARWLCCASASEGSGRQVAAERIADAFKNHASALQLSGLRLKSLPECLHRLKTVQQLHLDNNCLTKLPALPKKLSLLCANRNQLRTLPELPAELVNLEVCDNQLHRLPPLPENLAALGVTHNYLTDLPALPRSLEEINLSGNRLRSLPALPPNLTQLSVGYNQLTELPTLPPMLESVLVAHNLLRALPALPLSVFELDASDNRLERLPELFGSHINAGMFLAVDNPLPAHEIERLRNLPDSIVTGFAPRSDLPAYSPAQVGSRHPDAQTLHDALQRWQSDHASVAPGRANRWDLIAREDYALVFGNFLDRLVDTAEYLCPPYKPVLEAKVAELLRALENDPALRKLCFAIAEGAAATCGDRVALALNDMELARIGHDAERGTCSVTDLHATGLKMFRLSEVEKIANEKIQALHQAGAKFDEIEVRLGFHTLLLDQLQLPSLSLEMLHGDYAEISKSDLAAAQARVRGLSKSNPALQFMSAWSPWQEAMTRQFPAEFKLLQEKITASREVLDPKPLHLSEQAWIEAFAEQARIEIKDRADLTARLTERFQQPAGVS